ncbi:tyrosine-type recombinase/integrase [Tenacibaculum piscium]|uniref:tyrosine-type recombinase/integrase n=1 Tax=Tenacibaculum piscium TaxID=1458515 RepID=UPI00187B9427|nr:site-specific integrase [Tenacibaculum piscium]MBE7686266.1 tyrosine-type recombinase/integrase [Tenacibaculum piscium]
MKNEKAVKEYNISIRLDNRRKKDSGRYPIKLRVYGKITRKEKWYALDIDLSEADFIEIWQNPNNKKFRGAKKELELKLKTIETRANEVATEMTVFDFDKFETKLFRKSSDKNNVKYHFNLTIDKNTKEGKIGTAESYKYTLNSLIDFSENKKRCKADKLTFNIINVDWLKEYEAFMLSKNKSYTTIAIYTRTLRAVFNRAIESNDISIDIYPFGKNKYKIPRTKKVKKALSNNELKILFNAEVLNDNQQKAKDFFFFSYTCNGMNFKDIALLKYSDIKNGKFSYYRAKTFDKSAEKTEITIYLTDFTKQVINKYGNKYKDGFVFDIINVSESSTTQYNKIKNFTRHINEHLKKVAKLNGLPIDLSSYWARHSFATNSLRKGASMEFISEALNHSDLSVTKNYFAGFEDEAKKEFANSLLDF